MKVIAFDFDGTLASSFGLITVCFEKLLSAAGKPSSSDYLKQYYGPTEDGMCLNIFGPEKGPVFYKEYLELYGKYHAELIPDVNPGIRELLAGLRKAGFKVILLTGRGRDTTDISLSRLNLGGYFDAIYTGSPKGVNKPDNLKKAMGDYGIGYKDIVYVGDSLRDIESCREAGVDIVSVSYNNTVDPEKLESRNPGRVCHSVTELSFMLYNILLG